MTVCWKCLHHTARNTEAGKSNMILSKRASNRFKRRQAESAESSHGLSPSSYDPEVHSCFQTHNAGWPCQKLKTLHMPTRLMNSLMKNKPTCSSAESLKAGQKNQNKFAALISSNFQPFGKQKGLANWE